MSDMDILFGILKCIAGILLVLFIIWLIFYLLNVLRYHMDNIIDYRDDDINKDKNDRKTHKAIKDSDEDDHDTCTNSKDS